MSHLPPLLRMRPTLRAAGFLALGVGMLLAVSLPRPTSGQAAPTKAPAACEGGTAQGYPCKNVTLLSHLPIRALGGTNNTQVNDVWGWTDPQTGTEYALVGRTDGTAFVDVSTPRDPVYLGELPTHTEPSTWRDVKVYQHHAFIVSEASGHGMQVLDLTQLRDVDPNAEPVTFNTTAHYDGVESAHNVVINSETGFAYIVGGNGTGTTCGGGLHMLDVQTPTSPTFVGCFANPTGNEYTHDAQCVVYQGPDSDYANHEICFNANETVLNIADVTNKDAPSTIANATYPQASYVHQAWLTNDHRYLYVDDELDEQQVESITRTRTLVFDVTNLDNPELVTSYSGTTGAADHNQYIQGTYAYQANYKSGLRILDVADPEQPEEIAFFDTVPSSNDNSFAGAWSTYPFFERNMVLISSIGEGLFVVEPRFSPILSFTGTRRDQVSLLRWQISARATTDRTELEHKPPEAEEWTLLKTLPGRSGERVREYQHAAKNLRPGTHQFRVRHLSTNGTAHTSDPVSVRILPSEAYVATGPFPNPVRSQALFKITLRNAQNLRVALYDALGRQVRLLHEGPVPGGVIQRFRIQADRRASGTYFLRVQGQSIEAVRTVHIVR